MHASDLFSIHEVIASKSQLLAFFYRRFVHVISGQRLKAVTDLGLGTHLLYLSRNFDQETVK